MVNGGHFKLLTLLALASALFEGCVAKIEGAAVSLPEVKGTPNFVYYKLDNKKQHGNMGHNKKVDKKKSKQLHFKKEIMKKDDCDEYYWALKDSASGSFEQNDQIDTPDYKFSDGRPAAFICMPDEASGMPPPYPEWNQCQVDVSTSNGKTAFQPLCPPV